MPVSRADIVKLINWFRQAGFAIYAADNVDCTVNSSDSTSFKELITKFADAEES